MIISRGFYGLKSSGAACRAKLAETLNCVDDIINLEHDPKEDIDALNHTYILK